MDVEFFKEQCITSKPDIIVQQHIIDGTSHFFEKVAVGDEFLFKKEIANILKVHIRDIVIVGSGKLGFSLKPDNSDAGLYLYKEFDFNYKQDNRKGKSDLDVAIVSSNLFDSEIENLYNHTGFYKSITWGKRNDFAKYVLKGRIAIRFLPNDFPLTNGVEIVQGKYRKAYGREINLEIYKSWHFFETYHQENIKNIYVNLIS